MPKIPLKDIILTIILFSAGYLRLSGLQEQNLLFYDESFILSRAAQLKEYVFSSALQGTESYIDSKILWVLLVVMSKVIFYDGFFSVYFLSLLFALASIILTYRYARILFDSEKIGLISAFLLAVLPSHIFYSRSVLPESASQMVVLLTLLAVSHGIKRGQPAFFVLAGFLTGLSFMLNRYRVIGLPFFVLTQIFFNMRQDSGKNVLSLRGIFSYAAGIFIPFIMYPIILLVLKAYHIYLPPYLEAVWGSALSHPWPILRPTAIFEYLYFIFIFEGTGFFFLFLLSLVFVRTRKACLLLWSFILLHLIVVSFVDERTVRNLSVIQPFMCILAGVSLLEVYRILGMKIKPSSLAILAILILICPQVYKSFEMTRYRLGLSSAIEWIKEKGEDKTFVSTNPAASLYSSQGVLLYPWKHISYSLGYLKENDFGYVVADPGTFTLYHLNEKYRWNGTYTGLVHELSVCQPIKTFHPIQLSYLKRMVFEANRDFALSLAILKDLIQDKNRVMIYDVEACLTK